MAFCSRLEDDVRPWIKKDTAHPPCPAYCQRWALMNP